MPAPYIEKLADKHHRSVEYVEGLWNKAKQQAEEQGHKGDWAYVVGVLKRMLGETSATDSAVDTITMDVPLLTRILELSREEVKSDADLHFVLTRIIAASKTTDVLTMQDYVAISGKSSEASLSTARRVLSRLRARAQA